MDGFYSLRAQLREEFYSLVKSRASEEKFVDFVYDAVQKCNTYNIKVLEVMLDLTLALVDLDGRPDQSKLDSVGDLSSQESVTYDADDESLHEDQIFPYHLTLDDCHRVDSLNHHYHHLNKTSKTSHQIVKYPRLCEIIIRFIFDSLRVLIKTTKCENEQVIIEYLTSTVGSMRRLTKVCQNEKKNCRIISGTRILNIILENTRTLIELIPDHQHVYLEPMMKCASSLLRFQLSGDHLKLLLLIIKDENTDLKLVLSYLEQLLTESIDAGDNGFGLALVEAGGIESALICFADVVRRAGNKPRLHSLAFSILLKMSQTNPYHMNKFLEELDGLRLVEYILVHPKCITSKWMLDYYLDYCLTKKGDINIVKSPKLIFHLISCWRAWHKDIRVAKLLYLKLIRLLHQTDPSRRLPSEERNLESQYINHNFNMLTAAGGIDLLMDVLRKCFVPLDDDAPGINQELVKLIVDLISMLIKHPPCLDVLLDVMDFVLFLHPDPKAYVESTADRTAFLHIIQEQKEDADILLDSDNQTGSNRNFAIASIADMLASIVKLTQADPQAIDVGKLIILANNSDSLVREKVLRLFLYCLRNCYSLNIRSTLYGKQGQDSSSKRSKFRTCIPVQLMANQLLKYPATIKMIQFCYGIIVGIEEFETVESVCLIFDIDTLDNDIQLDTLNLLIRLMTQLQDPLEIVSAVRFVHAYIRQLVQLGADEILSFLIDQSSDLIDSLMKIYFRCVENSSTKSNEYTSYETESNSSQSDDYNEVKDELDRLLILIVRYFIQNLQSGETIKSIENLLTYLDLMNSYVPVDLQYILRDRKVKILTTALYYCEHYEDYARQKSCGGKMEYYLKSLLKNNDFNTFPNYIPEARLNMHLMLSDALDRNKAVESKKANLELDSEGSASSLKETTFDERRLAVGSSEGSEDNLLSAASSEGGIPGEPELRKISENEVIERFKATIEFCVNFITIRNSGVIPSPLERQFIIKCVKLLSCCLTEYHLLMNSPSRQIKHKCQWFFILPNLERSVRAAFSRIVLYLLSPCDSMSLDERRYNAVTLMDLFTVDELLFLLDSNQHSNKINYRILLMFIQDLTDYQQSPFMSEASEDEDYEMRDDDTEVKLKLLIQCLEAKLGIQVDEYNDTSESKVDAKFRDVWLDDLYQIREDAQEKLNSIKIQDQLLIQGQSNSQKDEVINRILDESLSITRDVVNDKHEQRKIYLEELKQNKVFNYHIRQQWLSLIIGQTHERAIWFLENHYPRSWELNPVEGPSRIRRRLRPCKLMLEARYLRQSKDALSKSYAQQQMRRFNQSSDTDFNRDDDISELSRLNLQSNYLAKSCSQSELLSGDWYSHYGPHPLCSMIINNEQSMDSNELRNRMFTTDKIHFNCDCSIIRPNEVCDGEVSIASWCIHFIGERNLDHRGVDCHPVTSPQVLLTDQAPTETDSGFGARVSSLNTASGLNSFSQNNKCLVQRDNMLISTIVEDLWFDEIVEIWDRRYQLQDVGLEIFLTNNMTYLLSFRNNPDREEFKQCLMQEQHKMINLQRINLTTSLNRLTQQWRIGKMTNFDYLTCLNKLAGRSFNDLMQYPVFPFVLSNYTREELDLNEPNNFRRLDRPMAIQRAEKEANFVNTYNISQSTNLSVGPSGMNKPYHYGNHYSNSATVLHFLVRLPPFTQMLIQYQDNNFDQPDRTFHSIANTWQLITRDSNTDFKELIPEFFFLPEMFINFEQFELGCKQNNELVDDVKMPTWCPHSDARLFTLIHRQALESLHVSENLHNWIDLIFGFKQTGKAAIEAVNVFHPATYYGMIDLGQQAALGSTGNNSTIASGRSSTYSSDYISTDVLHCSSRQQQQDIERLALETMIKTYGQMPRQLFAQPVRQRSLVNWGPFVVQSQTKRIEPLRQVRGLKWGSYVGSPDENDIVAVKHKRIVLREFDDTAISTKKKLKSRFSLCLLPNGGIAMLKDNTSLILDYRADRKSVACYQVPLRASRYSRRAGLSSMARLNLFSNMIISRQQFCFVEPALFSASQFESASSSSFSLASWTTKRPKFSLSSLSHLNWSNPDGIIHIRHPAFSLNPNYKASTPLLQADSPVDSMSTCASLPQLNLLLVGYKSGAICAHIISTVHEAAPIAQYATQPQQLPASDHQASNAALSTGPVAAPSAVHFLHTTTSSSYNELAPLGLGQLTVGSQSPISLAGKTLQSVRSISKTTRWLYCHRKRISCMKINVSFGIIVSASDDGTSVIWDLNSLTYVRTIDYKLNSRRFNRRDRSSSSSSSSKLCNQQLADYLCTCQNSPYSEHSNAGENQKQWCICNSGVSLVAISDTLGDIVTVKDINNRLAQATDLEDAASLSTSSKAASSSELSDSSSLSSVFYVHTINGALVGFVDCHSQVTAVCYSNAPEGISVNVIVVGMADGLIRLYSSWDLTRVKEFHVSGLSQPINSLLYSRDHQLLYIAYQDGQLVVLRNKSKSPIEFPQEWSP